MDTINTQALGTCERPKHSYTGWGVTYTAGSEARQGVVVAKTVNDVARLLAEEHAGLEVRIVSAESFVQRLPQEGIWHTEPRSPYETE